MKVLCLVATTKRKNRENLTGKTNGWKANLEHPDLGYLQMTYLVLQLPAWSRNLTSKAIRRQKVHITDSGLAAHILGKSPQSLARPTDPARGQIIESFAVNTSTQHEVKYCSPSYEHIAGDRLH